jgi:hypothetical protein
VQRIDDDSLADLCHNGTPNRLTSQYRPPARDLRRISKSAAGGQFPHCSAARSWVCRLLATSVTQGSRREELRKRELPRALSPSGDFSRTSLPLLQGLRCEPVRIGLSKIAPGCGNAGTGLHRINLGQCATPCMVASAAGCATEVFLDLREIEGVSARCP